MLRALKILTLVAVLTAVPARAWAIPATDGFWTKANSDGYSLFLKNYQGTGGLAADNGTSQGVLGLAIDASFLYVMFAQQISVNDNSFGAGAQGWTHTFLQLMEGDYAQFTIVDSTPAHNVVFSNTLDYLNCRYQGNTGKTSTPCSSGLVDPVGDLGNTNSNDGVAGTGSGALSQISTSIQWNLLNNPCAPSGSKDMDASTASSPATNAAGYASNSVTTAGCQRVGEDWLFSTIWELKLNLATLNLGTSNLAAIANLMTITENNSPTKTTAPDTNACDDPYFTGSSIVGICGDGHAVPEPASLMLVGSGAVLLAAMLRRRNAA